MSGDGSHTFSVEAKDTAGNIGTPATFTWTLDTTAPTVSFQQTPANPSNSASARFAFTASDGALTCKLDSGAFAACSSPDTLTGLADGSHTFTVHATDTAGNVGTASFTWLIDTTPPVLVIDDAPPAEWPVNYYDVAFHSPESGVTFKCSLNGAASVACSSPDTITTTYGTSSSFIVEASDALGNTSSQQATWTSTQGLVLHYPWELGSTANTSLLSQRPKFSPDGQVTLKPGGGWGGAAAVNPAAHGYKGTTRPLTSSPGFQYTGSVWVLPQTTSGGIIFTNANSTQTAGMTLALNGTTVTLTVFQSGKAFTTSTGLTANRWSNLAVESTSQSKGLELIVNGSQTGLALAPTNVGFDAAQVDLTVGTLTNTTIDDLRFYNLALDTTTLCSEITHGVFSPAGACQALLPEIDLRFDDGTADDAGIAGVQTTLFGGLVALARRARQRPAEHHCRRPRHGQAVDGGLHEVRE